MKRVVRTTQNMLIEGPAEIKILEGEANIFNAILREEEIASILPGRVLPIVNEKGHLKLELSAESQYQLTPEELFPPSWHTAVNTLGRVTNNKKTAKALIIGCMNTGKSSLALFLANWFLKQEKPVGIIDADIGQSKIGPPGVIGAVKVSNPITSLYQVGVDTGYFIGDKSPSGHLLQMVTGVKKLTETLSADREISGIIIDTTGMIFGGAARALKTHKIELVSPDTVFTLERHRELEHIIRENPNQRFTRLSVPKKIEALSRPNRIQLRKRKLKTFSRDSCLEISLNLRKTRIQQSILRNGYMISKEFLPKEVMWAEISAEGLLIISKGELKNYRKEEVIALVKEGIKTLKRIKTVGNANLLKVEDKKRRLLECVEKINLEKLRLSILPHTFYNNLYVGLNHNGSLYGIGRIQHIDFAKELIHIEGHLLNKKRKRNSLFVPSSILLGFLRFNENWEEEGQRGVGRG